MVKKIVKKADSNFKDFKKKYINKETLPYILGFLFVSLLIVSILQVIYSPSQIMIGGYTPDSFTEKVIFTFLGNIIGLFVIGLVGVLLFVLFSGIGILLLILLSGIGIMLLGLFALPLVIIVGMVMLILYILKK
jgi:hypothetical protein